MNRGDLVETMFDTGALGPAILYGAIVASGPKAVTIVWESGIRNRVLRADCRAVGVKPARDVVEAERLLRRRGVLA